MQTFSQDIEEAALSLSERRFYTFPSRRASDYPAFWEKIHGGDAYWRRKYTIWHRAVNDFMQNHQAVLNANQEQLLGQLDNSLRTVPATADIDDALKDAARDFFVVEAFEYNHRCTGQEDRYIGHEDGRRLLHATNDILRWLYRHPERDAFPVIQGWIGLKIGEYGYEAVGNTFVENMDDVGFYIAKKLEDDIGVDMPANKCANIFSKICLTSSQAKQIKEIFDGRKKGKIEAVPISPEKIKPVFDANIAYLEETGPTGAATSVFSGNPYPNTIRAGRHTHGFRAATFGNK